MTSYFQHCSYTADPTEVLLNRYNEIINSSGRLVPTVEPGIYINDPRDLYTFIKFIGKGSYADVFHAKHKLTGQEVAIKIIQFSKDPPSESEIKAVDKELDVLQIIGGGHAMMPLGQLDSNNTNPNLTPTTQLNSVSSSCPYVIKYLESYRFSKQLWLVMEYCEFGSLELFLQTVHPTGAMCEFSAAALAKQLLLALIHLHSLNIIHRDFKTANILITGSGVIKVSDYGLSEINKMNTTGLCGTPYYLAPEVCGGQTYDNLVDVWSLGQIIYFVLTSGVGSFLTHFNPPQLIKYLSQDDSYTHFTLPGKSNHHVWTRTSERDLASLKLPRNQGWDSNTIDFLRCCFAPRKNRWSPAELLLHSFIYRVPRTYAPNISELLIEFESTIEKLLNEKNDETFAKYCTLQNNIQTNSHRILSNQLELRVFYMRYLHEQQRKQQEQQQKLHELQLHHHNNSNGNNNNHNNYQILVHSDTTEQTDNITHQTLPLSSSQPTLQQQPPMDPNFIQQHDYSSSYHYPQQQHQQQLVTSSSGPSEPNNNNHNNAFKMISSQLSPQMLSKPSPLAITSQAIPSPYFHQQLQLQPSPSFNPSSPIAQQQACWQYQPSFFPQTPTLITMPSSSTNNINNLPGLNHYSVATTTAHNFLSPSHATSTTPTATTTIFPYSSGIHNNSYLPLQPSCQSSQSTVIINNNNITSHKGSQPDNFQFISNASLSNLEPPSSAIKMRDQYHHHQQLQQQQQFKQQQQHNQQLSQHHPQQQQQQQQQHPASTMAYRQQQQTLPPPPLVHSYSTQLSAQTFYKNPTNSFPHFSTSENPTRLNLNQLNYYASSPNGSQQQQQHQYHQQPLYRHHIDQSFQPFYTSTPANFINIQSCEITQLLQQQKPTFSITPLKSVGFNQSSRFPPWAEEFVITLRYLHHIFHSSQFHLDCSAELLPTLQQSLTNRNSIISYLQTMDETKTAKLLKSPSSSSPPIFPSIIPLPSPITHKLFPLLSTSFKPAITTSINSTITSPISSTIMTSSSPSSIQSPCHYCQSLDCPFTMQRARLCPTFLQLYIQLTEDNGAGACDILAITLVPDKPLPISSKYRVNQEDINSRLVCDICFKYSRGYNDFAIQFFAKDLILSNNRKSPTPISNSNTYSFNSLNIATNNNNNLHPNHKDSSMNNNSSLTPGPISNQSTSFFPPQAITSSSTINGNGGSSSSQIPPIQTLWFKSSLIDYERAYLLDKLYKGTQSTNNANTNNSTTSSSSMVDTSTSRTIVSPPITIQSLSSPMSCSSNISTPFGNYQPCLLINRSSVVPHITHLQFTATYNEIVNLVHQFRIELLNTKK